MQEILKKIINDTIKPLLKNAGFVKKELTFYRKRNGLTELINLQKSQWNDPENVEFFVNIGIYSNEIALINGETICEFPKEYDCEFEQRIERIVPFGSDRFTIDKTTDIALLQEKISETLTKTIDFLNIIQSIDDFCLLLVEKNGLHNYEKILTFLSKTNREDLANKYVKNINNLMANDDRLPFFRAKMHAILYKYELYVPRWAKISWNTLNEIPKKHRSNQESIFLATFENNTYFVDLSFYKGEMPYRLEVWRSLYDDDHNQIDYWHKRYDTEAETHADLNYWLKTIELYTEALPEGIAGFNTLPKFEKRDISKAIISVLQANDYQYRDTVDVYPNAYMTLNFEKKGKIYSIKLNNVSPWFGLSEMSFEELYEILPLLSPFGFFCNEDFLNKVLTPKSTVRLNKFEQKQIKHWKPKTIGEVVFNQWD